MSFIRGRMVILVINNIYFMDMDNYFRTNKNRNVNV